MSNVVYKQNPSFWQKEPEPNPMESVYYYDMQNPDDWGISAEGVEEIMQLLRQAEEDDDSLMWWEVVQDDDACSEHSYWSWEGFAFEFDTIISLDIADNYNPDLPNMPEILTTVHSPLANLLPIIYTKDVCTKLNIQHN